jgi:hypothetical protein
VRRTYEGPAAPREEWWIVETEELGATACPSRTFAYQASEVCRGAPNFLKVIRVRPARPADPMDAIAIRQSQKEIQEVSMDKLQRSGALAAPPGTFRSLQRPDRAYLVPKRARA